MTPGLILLCWAAIASPDKCAAAPKADIAPHGRFAAEPREKAIAACAYDAVRAGAFAAKTTNTAMAELFIFSVCMNAKGYVVRDPR